MGPASKEVKTVAEAEAVLAKSEVVVFGFGDQPAHAKAAAKLRESVLFAHTSAEEVLQSLLLCSCFILVLFYYTIFICGVLR